MKKGLVDSIIPNWIVLLIVALLVIVIFFMPPNGLLYKAWKQSEDVTQEVPDARTVQLQTKDLDILNQTNRTLFREPINRPCISLFSINKLPHVPSDHELLLTKEGSGSYALTLRTTSTPAQIVDVLTIRKNLCAVLGKSAQQFYENYLQVSTFGKTIPDASAVLQQLIFGEEFTLTTSSGAGKYLWLGHGTDARYMYYPAAADTACFIPVEDTVVPLGCDVGSAALREQCAEPFLDAIGGTDHLCRFS
jgi:hypothetical protein